MSIAIALTKGRLEKETIKLLEKSGYGIESVKNKGRQLVFQDSQKDVQYFLVKANDCITYVQHGIGKCKFIVAGLQGKSPFDKVGHVKIGTKYPNIAKKYFLAKGMDVELIKIDGSVELAPLLGLCDGIVDIMETGTTLKENGLVVFDTVCEISARVIVNKASFKLKRKEISQVLEDLKESLGENDVTTN